MKYKDKNGTIKFSKINKGVENLESNVISIEKNRAAEKELEEIQEYFQNQIRLLNEYMTENSNDISMFLLMMIDETFYNLVAFFLSHDRDAEIRQIIQNHITEIEKKLEVLQEIIE